jgi:hypothetical protein
MKDVAGQTINVGDFIIYCTRDRNARLDFGYVESLNVQQGYRQNVQNMKIRKASAEGLPLNVVDKSYDYSTKPATITVTDTGKAWYTRLSLYGEQDNRILVTRPIA